MHQFYESGSGWMPLPPPASASSKLHGQNQSTSQVQFIYVKDNLSVSRPQKIPSRTGSLLRHLLGPIRVSALAEIELLLLTFCTGMQDAASFPAYHCFASNQTGNTIFLTLAAVLKSVPNSMFILSNVALSLGAFLIGVYVTGQIANLINCRSRAWLLMANFLQTLMVFAAAGLHFRYPSTLGVLGLLAFASGSQVVLSRNLDMKEISTAMATAAWVDLLVDPGLWQLDNRPRDRRMLFLAALVVGAFAGAGIYRHSGPQWSILISGLGKLMVTFMFLFNGKEKNGASEEKV